MLDYKIYYNCSNCEKEYWVAPLSGGDQDVIINHPCSKCGCGVKLSLIGVASLSLMKDIDAQECKTCIYAKWDDDRCEMTGYKLDVFSDKCGNWEKKK